MFEFEIEWLEPADLRGEELRATLAALAVRCGDSVVTCVHDRRARSVSDRLYCPLYPLACWLVANWFFLSNERRVATRRELMATYAHRHNWRFVGDGYAWPSLEIIPDGREVTLCWRRHAEEHQPLEFIGEGEARIPTTLLMDRFHALIEQVCARLETCGVQGTSLVEDWDYLNAMDREEREFCETAAALGSDPFATDDQWDRLLVEVAGQLPESTREEFFAATRADAIEPNASWIRAKLQEAGTSLTAAPMLARLMRHRFAVSSNEPPFRQGYSMAMDARKVLGLNGQPLSTSAFEEIGYATARFEEEQKADSSSAGLEGLQDVSADNDVKLIIRRRARQESQRFSLIRLVAEALFSRLETTGPSLITKAESWRQKRNRAFAAEFLAPADGIRAMLPGNDPRIDNDDTETIAQHFGVSPMVIQHQIENHDLASIFPSSWEFRR